jgi:hypothetical protein
MSDDVYGSDAATEAEEPQAGEEPTTMSYRAVGMGLPVITHSGDQFGLVVHVLEVPEEDLFDGIVVHIGTEPAALLHKHRGLAHFEMLRLGQLEHKIRFVDADQVAAITPGYVKCTFEMPEVSSLPVPDGPPVLHPDMAEEDAVTSAAAHPFYGQRYGQYYGQWFGRPRWRR